ncbi:MAG: hypothetical protein ACRD0J_16320, partial [Acidimicrobiales bacterium]
MAQRHRRVVPTRRLLDAPLLAKAPAAVLLTLGAGAVVVAAGARPAGASGNDVLPPDHLIRLVDPGVVLTPPADGRLVGTGFSIEILGSAQVTSAGSATDMVKAPKGDRLEVFVIDLRRTDVKPHRPAGQGLILAVQAGGRRLPMVRDDLATTGVKVYALAVAPREPVELVALDAGTTQSFSLTARHRISPDIVAFYRAPASPSLLDTVDAQKVLVGHDVADQIEATDTLTLSSASLNYASPAGVPAPSPDQAFVVLSTSEAVTTTDSSGFVPGFLPISPDRLQLVIPGKGKVPAQWVAPADQEPTTLLGATYYFLVPADITTASVVITPGTAQAAFGPIAGTSYPVTFTGSATFPLSFPVLAAPAAPALPPTFTVAAHHHASVASNEPSASGPIGSSGAGGGPSPAWFAFLALVPLIGGGLYFRRRQLAQGPARGVGPVPWAAGGVQRPWRGSPGRWRRGTGRPKPASPPPPSRAGDAGAIDHPGDLGPAASAGPAPEPAPPEVVTLPPPGASPDPATTAAMAGVPPPSSVAAPEVVPLSEPAPPGPAVLVQG